MKKIRILLCTVLLLTLCVLALGSCGAEIDSPDVIRFDKDTQSISWDKVPGAIGYRVSVGDREKVIRTTSYVLDFLEPGDYVVYVKAIGSDSSESDAIAFEYTREQESGLSYKLINGNTEYQLIGVGEASGDVVMEDVYRGKPVTSIAPSALANNDKIKSFVIGKNVSSIPKKAFYNCKALESVTIPDNVKSIGENAFQSCRSLLSVVLPEAVTEVSDFTFSYCRALESVSLSGNTTRIGNYAFSDCSALKSIELPDTVDYVGDYAFSACEAVSSLTLGDKIQIIGEYAFYRLKLVESVKLPGSLRSIGNSAFEECAGIKAIALPQSLVSLGERAFAFCENLEQITAGNNIESIGRDALHNTAYLNESADDIVYLGKWVVKCKNPEIGNKQDISLLIKDGVVGIADYAFYKCELFTGVNLESIVYLGEYAFSKCTNLVSIRLGESAKRIGDFAFYDCENLKDVIISHTSIETIGDFAFYCCLKLKNVELPSTIEMIGSRAFSNTNISPAPDGVLYVGKWAVGCVNSFASAVTIRDGTVGIAKYSFLCPFLQQVKFPDTLKIIGKGAFLACEFIAIEEFPSSLKEIGDYAFYGCTNGMFGADYNLVLPEGLERIGRSAFYGSSVCGIEIPGSCRTIGDYAFYECMYLGNEVTFRVNDPNAENGEQSTVTRRYHIKINDGVEQIGYCAFYKSGIIDIEIPDSVEEIGAKAFFRCEKLESVKIGSGLKQVPEYCFFECENLTDVVLSDGVLVIDEGSFSNCKKLENLTLSSTVEKILDNAFMGCEAISRVDLPESVTVIGDYAFRGLKSLRSLVLNSTVSEIGIHAFYGCNGLTVYTDATEPGDSWDKNWNSSWRPVVWGCSFSDDGGYVESISIGENSVINFDAVNGIYAPERSGYVFEGWSDVPDGVKKYTASDITSVSAGTTLYALWHEHITE